MNTLRRLLVIGWLFAAAPGCSTYHAYPGPKRPRAKVALVGVAGARDLVVDGVAVPGGSVTRVALLPGSHELTWTFVYPNAHRGDKRLALVTEAGQRYRLGQRFRPAPNPGGFLGATADVAATVGLAPITLLFPPEPAEGPPPGEYYAWIMDEGSREVCAGVAPDMPVAHAPIALLPIEPAAEPDSQAAAGPR